MKTLTMPDGTSRHILEDDEIPTEIPEMTLVELQAAYMGMLTALVSMFGPEVATQMQAFAYQYLEQMLLGPEDERDGDVAVEATDAEG